MLTALVLALSLVAATAPGAAQSSAAEEMLVVSLDEDGSARVSLRLTYDLSDDDRRAAFESLRGDATARERRARAFGDRMRGVAAAIAAETGRSTRVGNVSIDLRTVDRTGVVELTATVDGFAAASGDRVRVRAPFASGFVTDRPLVLAAPDGFERTTVTPAPDASEDGRLRWDANRDLSGFEATFESADGGSDARAPGVGAVGALAALVAVGALAARRGRR
ncbi:MAG: PGF-CTERM sorting domain-containing protein [Haloferacaceae archaeon]